MDNIDIPEREALFAVLGLAAFHEELRNLDIVFQNIFLHLLEYFQGNVSLMLLFMKL